MPRRSYIEVTVDGKAHQLALAELSIGLVKECRRVTGTPPMRIVALFQAGEADIDTLAAFVWLARRHNGERVTLDDVETGLSYDSDITMRFVNDEPEEADSPEV